MIEIKNHFSDGAWVEGNSLDQLKDVAALEGAIALSAFPDLHPGKHGPVGIGFLASRLYPLIVGNDIGCGMSLFKLDIPARKVRADKAADRLRHLANGWEGDGSSRLEEVGLPPDLFADALGTVGGGNHFCELQAIDEEFHSSDLDPSATYILVHSGSRSLGAAIADALPPGIVKGFEIGSEACNAYMQSHDQAVSWASLNRTLIAEQAAKLLRADVSLVADVPHNMAEGYQNNILHRKGAARAVGGLIPIAGSRATLSYVVETAAHIEDSLHTLSHGAGRKYDRASMQYRVGKTKSDREALTRNKWGGHIVCEDKQLLLEEAPEAYKDAGRVVADLEALGLSRTIAAFRPIVTFKRAYLEASEDKGRKDREIQRRKERTGR